MPGQTSLDELLRTLEIKTHPGTFVFVTLAANETCPISLESVQMTFREHEGLTLIVDEQTAEKFGGLKERCTFRSKMLTCDVHSSLEAVGFMAVIVRALADAGISCNPVSGYYHDHLFVPVKKVKAAEEILQHLSLSKSCP